MSDKPIPRRLFLKKAGAVAGTAAATGLTTNPPSAGQTVPAGPAVRSADLILSNAKVITVDRDFTIAQAIAIAGDRILAGSERYHGGPHRARDARGRPQRPDSHARPHRRPRAHGSRGS